MENGHGPGEVDEKVRVIGLPPQSWKVVESMYKYLQIH